MSHKNLIGEVKRKSNNLIIARTNLSYFIQLEKIIGQITENKD